MAILRSVSRQSRRERMRRIDRGFQLTLQLFLVCYFLFVLLAWVSYRPELRISEVRIEGAQAVDSTAVGTMAQSMLAERFLWKIDRNNRLFYPKRAMIQAIKALDTHVKEVTLTVVGKKQLLIHLSEYSPEFLWCSPGSIATSTTVTALTTGCYFADSTGHLYAEAPDYSGNLFLTFETTIPEYGKDSFLSRSSILPKGEFDTVSMFLHKLDDLELSPQRVEQSGPHDFTFITDKSWTIRWLSTRNPDEDVANLSLVLQNLNSDHTNINNLKSIDLRFGNKVFYR